MLDISKRVQSPPVPARSVRLPPWANLEPWHCSPHTVDEPMPTTPKPPPPVPVQKPWLAGSLLAQEGLVHFHPGPHKELPANGPDTGAHPRTAFTTTSGHWQYRVLPFSFHGAPTTFQRLMDIVLCPPPPQVFTAAYLDGVIVHSSTWANHLLHLKSFLWEWRQAGLTANPQTCHLGLTEVQYLG